MKYLAIQVENFGQISPPPNIPTSSSGLTLSTLISFLLGFAIAVGIIFTLAMIVYGGFNWITSEGDKKKIEAARNTIVWSFVGLFLMVAALLIINIFTTALSLNGALIIK
ncbi:MAG: hypothetical protein COU27_01590 [Candidatus Levybacteria bacterium CG10_big_fil_rev_8_21_14_0_10_36_7]|nr:MAG: hypothetical protein COU27_01590 [Candidatus Levybacteria bacterium CG10_big_fil_rev_8_21_14_0_10_36_7]